VNKTNARRESDSRQAQGKDNSGEPCGAGRMCLAHEVRLGRLGV
jgi:hypothetical protein